ncbi:MAG: hypothetical protein V7785_21565 [Bermanella sp.]
MYKLVEHCLLPLAAGYKQASPIKMLLTLPSLRLIPDQVLAGFGASQPFLRAFDFFCFLFNERMLGYKASGNGELTAISAVWRMSIGQLDDGLTP